MKKFKHKKLSERNNTNLDFLTTQIIMEDEYVLSRGIFLKKILKYFFSFSFYFFKIYLESEKVPFNISSILPEIDTLNTDGYYRYIGSLTTPPCTEGIIWSIFRTRINISEWQVSEPFF